MFNVDMKKLYKSELRLVSFTIAIPVTILYIVTAQTSWAAIITCLDGVLFCNGTPADDIIIGNKYDVVINGFAGNDYIVGAREGHSYISGDNGNDTLIGGKLSDTLLGGKGDDMYDGLGDDDTILENISTKAHIISNDIVSGGLGNDWIATGGGADTINGGPGHDQIWPNLSHRDFSPDYIDCGSGNDFIGNFYSGDRETATYCETIINKDG
jgi:Ca2+-binding RTX toxin-like protein